MRVEMSTCTKSPGAEVQQVSPITTLEGLAGAVGALNRTALGLEGFVLLVQIDRLNRKKVHPDLEMLRRIIGAPKTQVWTRLSDIEGMGLIRIRRVRRLQRLVIAITPLGREALTCTAHSLQQDEPDHSTTGTEAQDTASGEPIERPNQQGVRSRSRPRTRDLHVVGI